MNKFKDVMLLLCSVILILIIIGVSNFRSTVSAAESVRTLDIQIEYTPAVQENAVITPEGIVNTYGIDGTAAMMAKVVYGEARGLSTYHQSLVCWCILNRVDDGRYGADIETVIEAPYQFVGYHENNPVIQEHYDIAMDVLIRWQAERYCIGPIGRTLPKQYVNFRGDGRVNWFTDRAGNVFQFGEDIYDGMGGIKPAKDH